MTEATAQAAVKFAARIDRIEPSATMAVVAEADRLRQAGVDVVDLSVGEPHFFTPQHIKEAGIAAIHNNFTRYTPVGGTAELKRAIVERHAADFGSAYKSDEVAACVGGKHALFNTIQVLVDHGDEVILPVPYWVSFKDIVRYAGGSCVLLETGEENGFRASAEMIRRLVTPRTRLIILNSPANPSGAVMSSRELTEVARFAAERGIWVVSDECYVYLNFSGQRFSVGSLHAYRERIVVVGSLSKTYAMTGWRMGYALAPAKVVKAIEKLESQSTSNPTSIVQKAAVAALTGSQECIEQMRGQYVQLRDRLLKRVAAVPGISCAKPEGAFYLYPNISAFLGRRGINSPAEFARRLLAEAHVATVPGEGFGTNRHIRMSYATSEKELDRGAERLEQFLAKLGSPETTKGR